MICTALGMELSCSRTTGSRNKIAVWGKFIPFFHCIVIISQMIIFIIFKMFHFLDCSPTNWKSGKNSQQYSMIKYDQLLTHSCSPLMATDPNQIDTIILRRIWHVNVQRCLLINFQYKPISLQYSWLSVDQPISIDLDLQSIIEIFPINYKTIKC